MTSYHTNDQGRSTPNVLPPRLEETAYKPIEGLVKWIARQRGRWIWCGKCQVNIAAEKMREHQAYVHPKNR